jgi:hypothetical protein
VLACGVACVGALDISLGAGDSPEKSSSIGSKPENALSAAELTVLCKPARVLGFVEGVSIISAPPCTVAADSTPIVGPLTVVSVSASPISGS